MRHMVTMDETVVTVTGQAPGSGRLRSAATRSFSAVRAARAWAASARFSALCRAPRPPCCAAQSRAATWCQPLPSSVGLLLSLFFPSSVFRFPSSKTKPTHLARCQGVRVDGASRDHDRLLVSVCGRVGPDDLELEQHAELFRRSASGAPCCALVESGQHQYCSSPECLPPTSQE